MVILEGTMIKVIPLTTTAQDEERKLAMQMDNHFIKPATHIVIKNGEIVGSLLIGPIVDWWMYSTKTNRKDSVMVFVAMETLLANMGIRQYLIHCPKDSPYSKRMESSGYTPLYDTTIYQKEI